MGLESCLPKKLRKWHCYRNYIVYEVEPSPGEEKYEKLCDCFERYWETISPDSDNSVLLLDNGLRLREHEGQLAYYYGRCDRVRVIEYLGKVIGFMIYQFAFDGVLLIRGLYVVPEYTGFGLGKGLVNSLKQPVKKLLFQTRKEVPPTRLLGHVAAKATKIFENSDMNTWEMTWEVQ